MQCIECGSSSYWKAGKTFKDRVPTQRYRCRDCGRHFTEADTIVAVAQTVKVKRLSSSDSRRPIPEELATKLGWVKAKEPTASGWYFYHSGREEYDIGDYVEAIEA